MTKLPKKIKETQLQNILCSDIDISDTIKEDIIKSILIDNPNIDWSINPFILRQKLVRHFGPTNALKGMRDFKLLNWIIAGLILGFTFYTNDYNYLWTLVFYALLTTSGVWDYWIFLCVLTILTLYGLFQNIHTNHYWFNIAALVIGYHISKLTIKVAEKKLFEHITSDIRLFYKCYMYNVIDTYSFKGNSELERIELKYNEMNRQKYSC
ncbi:hypothetical protein BH10BAC2_BH10BAC2_13710 [soil metagenome]